MHKSRLATPSVCKSEVDLRQMSCIRLAFVGMQTVSAGQPLNGPAMAKYRELARETKLWLSLGGFQEKGPDSEHIYNTHVILNAEGEIASSYRKVWVVVMS